MRYLLILITLFIVGCSDCISPECVPEEVQTYTYIPFPGNKGQREEGFSTYSNCMYFGETAKSYDPPRYTGTCEVQYEYVGCE